VVVAGRCSVCDEVAVEVAFEEDCFVCVDEDSEICSSSDLVSFSDVVNFEPKPSGTLKRRLAPPLLFFLFDLDL